MRVEKSDCERTMDVVMVGGGWLVVGSKRCHLLVFAGKGFFLQF